MKKLGMVAACAGLLFLGACSSIVEGTSQEVVINTNPAGASCNLVREGISIARVTPTPGAATIRKTKHDLVIECEMDGFHKATYFNKSDAAGATFGNIILGGGIGWAIDSASGADNKYTSPVNITLVPSSAPAPAPIYSSPEPQKEASSEEPRS